MMNNLTQGSIQRMLNNDTTISPRLQVLDVRRIVTGNSGERFRLVLSDGQYFIQGMLATQMAELVNTNKLQKYAIIHLKEFVCNPISGKKVCVVIRCDVVQQMSSGIGKPQSIFKPPPGHIQTNPPIPSNRNQNRPAPPQNQAPFHQRNNNQNYNENQSNFNMNRSNNNNNTWNDRNNNNNRGGYSNYRNYGNNADPNIQPVSSLNPYQNAWRIKVRCTRKDTMRHYHNQKGDGKLFGVDLLDKHGTEIRAVCFNDAAEKFFSIFAQNGVYLISKGSVRLARKGFSHIKNDYSITLNADAEVVAVNDDQHEISQQKYKFTKIGDIGQIEAKQFVDVIGVIIDVGPLSVIMSNRTQQEMKRRNIKIADPTAKIDVTLWNDDAENFNEDKVNENPNTIIALKGCKVSDFGGRSLSASGFIDFHPALEETRKLLHWATHLKGGIKDAELNELTTGKGAISGTAPRRTFQEVKDMRLGENRNRMDPNQFQNDEKQKPDFFTVIATITTISHSTDKKPWYEGNPDPNSDHKFAKVTSMGDGKWRCEKNGKVYKGYVPRYILRFCATDFTGNVWLTAFNECAEKILKKTAAEAEKMFNDNHDEYEEMFRDATFKKYVFKCKAYSDMWEDSQRVRYDCVGVQIADPQQESQKIIQKIQFLQNLKNNNSNCRSATGITENNSKNTIFTEFKE